ncbi:MAG: hypothetical protein QOD77_905 [Thermoplasmata archaeon]|nr:hypothetical protein [Thermoplasmata archaeon]
MADLRSRRPENAPGGFFVDATCIDCDTCRWMAPGTFARVGRQSAVAHQPASPAEERAALQALVSCPTASIGAPPGSAVAAVAGDFPLPVTPHVGHLGYHSEASFGGAAWLLRHPEGNVMVDAPRFAAPLAKRIEALGGLRLIVLTHRDDVADHDKWARRFGAERVLHERDAPVPGGPVERLLMGDDPVELLPGLWAIPTPGHTRGHTCYLWEGDGGVLFTGDHLAYDDEAGRLEAWPDVCWFDWGAQTASMRKLLAHDFEWVLPGHGRKGHLPGRMKDELARLVAWMERQ